MEDNPGVTGKNMEARQMANVKGTNASRSLIPVVFSVSILLWFLFSVGTAMGAIGTLEISPLDDFESVGFRGGPFTPDSKEYLLLNNEGGTVYWGVSKTVGWIDFDSD